METSSVLKTYAFHGYRLFGHIFYVMLSPRTPATWTQSSDIYVNMVKLLCGSENLSLSFPAWYFQFGIATLHLRALLHFKHSVVLQHMRNSQGP
jgi:hypothetical protein